MSSTVRAWALLDLLVTGLLVFPDTAEPMLRLFHSVSSQELPAFAPIHQLMTSLAGLLARLRTPNATLAGIDVMGRAGVGAFILWFVLGEGAPEALLAFSVSEFAGAAHQALALHREASDRFVA